MKHSLGRASRVTAYAFGLALCSTAAPAQTRGLFVQPQAGPAIELKAYAETVYDGKMKMISGTLEDVPTVIDVRTIASRLPNWRPAAVLLASENIFRVDRSETRQLPFAHRALSIFAVELRVADLESRERMAPLLDAVGASADVPGYAFILLTSGGSPMHLGGRYYPVRLKPEPAVEHLRD